MINVRKPTLLKRKKQPKYQITKTDNHVFPLKGKKKNLKKWLFVRFRKLKNKRERRNYLW